MDGCLGGNLARGLKVLRVRGTSWWRGLTFMPNVGGQHWCPFSLRSSLPRPGWSRADLSVSGLSRCSPGLTVFKNSCPYSFLCSTHSSVTDWLREAHCGSRESTTPEDGTTARGQRIQGPPPVAALPLRAGEGEGQCRGTEGVGLKRFHTILS